MQKLIASWVLIVLIFGVVAGELDDSACSHYRYPALILNRDVVILGARNVGIFSELFAVLNWLNWEKKMEGVLKVVWDDHFIYANDTDNHWEDFFDCFWDEGAFSGDNARTSYAYSPSRDTIVYLLPKNRFYRRTCYELIQEYIKVKPEIMEEVRQFYDEHLAGKHVIAVHLRSREKDREGKQVPPQYLIDLANSLKKEDTVFFVLTDCKEYLDYARQRLEGPIFSTSCLRVENSMESVHGKYSGNLRLAREALVDCLIAAQCTSLVFTTSNLAFGALAFSPNLRGISLRYAADGSIEYYDYPELADRDVYPRLLSNLFLSAFSSLVIEEEEWHNAKE